MKKSHFSVVGVLALAFIGFAIVAATNNNKVMAEDKAEDAKAKFEPVDNMHHFMEYINEPVYQSLEATLKTAPADKQAWSKVKSGALILAETSALVAQRGDNKDDALWQSSSLTVHEEGKKLYKAARAKDYEAAQKFLKSMTAGCTACHKAFR